MLWKTNLGAPVTRNDLPCGNISPLGITGTPVYDPATKLIFAVAETSGPKHELVALDIDSGQVRQRRSADPPGMSSPEAHQERAALALNNGIVYVAYGGLFGDCGDYHGTVIGARTDGQGSLMVYQVPTTREAGIWAPPGPVIDANGKLYVSVGNGEATSGAWDKSDSVLRLSPQLQYEDGFAPTSWPSDNARRSGPWLDGASACSPTARLSRRASRGRAICCAVTILAVSADRFRRWTCAERSAARRCWGRAHSCPARMACAR